MDTQYPDGGASVSPTGHESQPPKKRARKATPPKVPATRDNRPDEGLRGHKRMAYRFARMFKGTFIHTPGRGWLQFNGAFWEDCGDSGPWNGVGQVCREALRDLVDLPAAAQTDLFADVRACDSATGTAGVIKHAQHWPGIAVRDEDLDTHKHLWVTRNGTYDLVADLFRASDPAELMTLAAGCDYDEAAQCPMYDHLLSLYQADPEIRAYLHRLGGAAMWGGQNLQQLIIHYGQTGGNGKGTIQRAWQAVFGDYADVFPVEMVIVRRGYDQYRDEKAQLKGKRLVYLSEPSPGQKFDTGTVKSILGGEKLRSIAVYK
jgi:putative DNA primase/helicase